jgi:hypothetical protein
VREETGSGTIRNFPLQANGAEILRLACCLLIKKGIRICAPVHDAVLIEAPADEIEGAVRTCGDVMAQAASIILGGFPLRTDHEIVAYPDRYMDDRGREFWDQVYEMMAPNRTCPHGRGGHMI